MIRSVVEARGELGGRLLPGNAWERSPHSIASPPEEVGSESRDSDPTGGGAVGAWRTQW